MVNFFAKCDLGTSDMSSLTISNIGDLENRLKYSFRNRKILQTALTHPSYSAEKTALVTHNQRLEFLGDAVLQIVVTEMLFKQFPEHSEGVLSKARSALTNEDALEQLANQIQLGDFLRLGKGEEQSGGRERKSNLADAMEAVLGAMYVEDGLDAAREFLQEHLQSLIETPQSLLKYENPKGTLQEFTQEKCKDIPEYRTLEVTGPEHAPEFAVQVVLGGRVLATARAETRKKAEKKAACHALESLNEIGESL